MPVLLNACNSGENGKADRDTSINVVTSFNNLFLDSVQLEQFLQKNATFKSHEKQFLDFYKQRNYEYAWFDKTGLGEQAGNFINLLNNTINNQQDSSLYNAGLYTLYNNFSAGNGTKHKSDEVLNTELSLTGQFFNYAAKMYKGTDSSITDLGWFIPRKKVNLAALLDSVILSKNKAADEFAPLNNSYKKLKEKLPVFFKLQQSGNWDSITKPEKPVHLGETSEIIPLVKDRLYRLGDLKINDSTNLLDSNLFTAAKSFQHRMGLGVDGAVGAKMITELNVTPAERVRQILVNLERMRWMTPQTDSNYIFVNIPEYKMYVYTADTLNFSMNVIVGTTANSTVIFSGNLKNIVFSPYWNVPVKIVKNEIIPGIRKNPDYLAKHNMVRTGGSDSLPSIRQNPGPSNSLGRVKFLFPNNYDIYFHDTPNRNLFSASSRSFSHGCIRVGEPKHLAQYLLRNDTAWTNYRMDTAMNNTKETWVTLKKSVPVVIAYFTAWVDKNGELNFRKDIYGHDAKLANKLFINQ
ncbi:MAG: L,D-transpeptidase family protein [Panacibacter sp.]